MKSTSENTFEDPDDRCPPVPVECVPSRDAMQRRLDGDLTAVSDDIRLHRSHCSECRSLEAASLALESALPHLPKPRPSANFADRILAQAVIEPHRTVWRSWRMIGSVFALAASLLIAVAIITNRSERVQLVVNLPTPIPVIPAPPHVESAPPLVLRESLQEANSAVANLTRKASIENLGLKMPKWQLGKPKTNPISKMEPAVAGLQNVQQGAIFSVAPITNSARRAVDLFWRELGPDLARQPARD